MEIIYKNLSKINRYANNPRRNQEAVEAVAASIREFGFRVPIILDGKDTIVAGDTRYLAAEVLGLEEVPCVYAADLSEDKIKAFRLADNKVAEIAKWDFDLLEVELSEIDLDMTAFGFDVPDIDVGNIEDDEYEVELPEEPKSKPGEIYLLGNHRLMCGDCTSTEDMMQLMDGAKADILLTDPPYNVDITGGGGLKIQNDNMEKQAFREFLGKAFAAADVVMNPGAAFYIWHSETEGYNFRSACLDIGWQVRQCLIWVKNNIVLGHQDYQWKHEPCLYGWKDGAAHYFKPDRTQPTVWEDRLDINAMKKDELKATLKSILSSDVPSSVIHENKPAASPDHPTMKPIPLLARMMRNSSQKGDIALDGFGGSGSTLITAGQMERNCYMMEIDPRYVDVTIDRWERFTGRKAERV